MIANLKKVNKKAAPNTSRAISKILKSTVSVKIVKAAVKDMKRISPIIDPEEIIAGIYLPVTGDVKGAALIMFPKNSALILSDLLTRKKIGTTQKLEKLQQSALKELGNIVCGSYFTVLSNVLKFKAVEHLPNFSLGMFGAILSQVISNFVKTAEKAIVIEIEFNFKEAYLKGYFILLFKVDDFNKVFKKAGRNHAGN